MDRDQFLQDVQKLQILARRLNQNLTDFSASELAALGAVLPDLAPLFRKFRTPNLNTGELVDRSHREHIETELRRLLEENRRQKSLLDAIFAADPSGLAVVAGPELRFVYANPAYRYICPCLGNDPTGSPYEHIWPADNGDGFHAQIQSVLETGRPFQMQAFERDYPDGSKRVFTFQARRMQWGSEPAALLIFWDTTDLINSQRQLVRLLEQTHHQAEEMQGLFNAMSDAVIIYDTEGEVLHANPALIQFLGFDPTGKRREEIAAKMIYRWPDARIMNAGELPTVRALRGELVERERIHLTNPAGRTCTVQMTANLLYSPEKQVSGVVVVWHDVTEQEQSEAALRKSEATLRTNEARYRELANSITDPFFAYDSDLRLIYRNQAAQQIAQIPTEQLLGKTFVELYPTMLGSETHQLYLRVLETHQPETYRTHWVSPQDGRELYFDLNVYPTREGIAVLSKDITGRIEAEQRLAAEREWYRITLASIGDAVITTDAQGMVTFLNPVAEHLTGWAAGDAAGRPMEQVFDIINEQTRQPAVNPVGKVLAHGAVVGLANHTALIARDGRQIPIEDSAAPIKDIAGQTLGVVLVFHDVTSRRQVEHALHESRMLLQTVLQETPDPIYMKDRDSRILLANPATLKLIGKPAGQVIGKNDGEYYDDPAVGRAIMENDQRVMESGQTLVVEERVLRPGELERIYLSTKTPYRDTEGNVIGIIGVARDISDRKRRERELDKLNRTLQALNESNQAMLRASDEGAFMQDVCRIITEDCGYAMVWIGLAEQDAGKTVRPVACAGFDDGYLNTLHITWADTERGHGPTGTAIRSGQPSICRNMFTDPKFIPWRAEASKRGYAASLVLPMLANGQAFGAINIYAREPDSFNVDEITLLSELASDLAYGITAMRVRAAHARAEQALRESEERYRSLFQGMTEGFALHEIVCDEHGVPADYRFLDLNPAFERLTGLALMDIKGKLKSEVEQLRGDDPRWIEIYGKVALTGEPLHFENYSPALQRHYEVFAYRPAPLQFAVIFMDITERKQAEDALRRATEVVEKNKTQLEVQRRLIEQREQERQRIARDLHDGPVQMVTGVTFSLQGLAMAGQDPQLVKELNEMRASLQEVINDLRGYAQELRPPVLFKFGVRRAIQSHLENFKEKHPELHIQLEVDWAGELLPEQVSIALFRVYQECLNNILKHAQATEIRVRISRDEGQMSLVIEDNGAGFTLPEDLLLLAREGHLGLVGMHERVEAVGGSLEIVSRPGQGTRIRVRVPLR